MTPSNPAVTVPIRTPIEEYCADGAALHSRGASLYRRKTDAHVVPLHPEPLLLVLAEIHREEHAASAGPAARYADVGKVIVAGVRPEVFLEFFERVIPARRGVGAAEQCVRTFVILGFQQGVELLDAAFFAVIMKNKEQRATHDHERHNRYDQSLYDFCAPLIDGAVLLQITGHSLLRLWLTLLRERERPRDTAYRRPRWLPW